MDLDDDELRATRRLNGLDKMQLEEAIEILKSMQSYMEKDEDEKEAIETVLQELKNSIPKKKIEKLIDDLYGDDNTIYGTIRIIEMLKELLEDK